MVWNKSMWKENTAFWEFHRHLCVCVCVCFLPLSSFYTHAKLILVEFIELLGGGKDKQICQNAATNQNRIG